MADALRFFLKWTALVAGILLFGFSTIIALLQGLYGDDRPILHNLLWLAASVVAGGITGGLLALAIRNAFRRRS